MHQWQKFGENLSIDTGDIVETWKSGMHSVMPWPWTLTFRPQNLISSSLCWGAPVRKVRQKSIDRYWTYRGNIKFLGAFGHAVTLTFDLLTPKCNQFISVPRCSSDKSLEKIRQPILETSRKHKTTTWITDGWTRGCTDSGTDGRPENI